MSHESDSMSHDVFHYGPVEAYVLETAGTYTMDFSNDVNNSSDIMLTRQHVM